MAHARIHPPSEQRVAEAQRQGHVPRAPLVGLFALWCALCAGLFWQGHGLFVALAELLRASLLAGASRALLAPGAQLWNAVGKLAPSVGLMLLLAWAALASSVALVQGPVFAFAGRARIRVEALAPGRTARVLFVLGLLGLCGVLTPRVLRVTPDGIVALLRDAALYTAFWLALCALVDASFARARHLRSLWLTRGEFRDEQREAHGSPEVRAARERARREHGSRS